MVHNISRLFVAYLIVVHVFLFWLLTNTYAFQNLLNSMLDQSPHIENTDFYRNTLAFQYRVLGNSSKDQIVFIGDSHIQGLNTSKISKKAINLGIGGDTTTLLYKRIKHFDKRLAPDTLVLAIGVNDLPIRAPESITNNVAKITELLNDRSRIVISGLLPVASKFEEALGISNEDIRKTNALLTKQFAKDDQVIYLAPPEDLFDSQKGLRQELHLGDGLHLNAKGYDIWINYLKRTL